jgi:hypothetical protein
MCVRGLVCVIHEGKFVLAHYLLDNSEPTGIGQRCVDFLIYEMKRDVLLTKLHNIQLVEHFEDGNDSWDVLGMIQEDDNTPLAFNLDFAADGLCCEWAYVLNMDADEFEVYRGDGVQAKYTLPLSANERFAFLQYKNMPYRPVRLVAKYAIKDLDVDTMKNLLDRIETPEDREDRLDRRRRSRNLGYHPTYVDFSLDVY